MKKVIGDLILIMFGGFILAIGMNYFLIPNMLSEGGVIGITIVIHYIYDVSPGFVNFILNVVLVAIGYKFFDKKTISYTLFSIVSTSIFLYITEANALLITEDTLLAAVFAGLLIGGGLGFIFRTGGTNGGTTILAKIANQLWGLSVSKGVFLTDLVVVAGSTYIIGFENAMYTLITVFVGAKAIDFISVGLDEKVAVLIMSTAPKRILEEITHHMARGITVLEGRGGYTGDHKEVLYIVISQTEIAALRNIINEIDDQAYVTVNNVHEMLGKGYKAQATRKNKLRKVNKR